MINLRNWRLTTECRIQEKVVWYASRTRKNVLRSDLMDNRLSPELALQVWFIVYLSGNDIDPHHRLQVLHLCKGWDKEKISAYKKILIFFLGSCKYGKNSWHPVCCDNDVVTDECKRKILPAHLCLCYVSNKIIRLLDFGQSCSMVWRNRLLQGL